MRVPQSGLLVYFLFVLAACSSSAMAQVPQAPDIPDLPQGVVLPEVPGEGGSPRLINSSSAAAFRAIILPELYGLVRSDAFQMEAARRLQYAWRYDDEFERNSLSPYTGGLSENGWLQPGDLFRRWFVFGNAQELEKEESAVLQGQKILWNINSVWWSQGSCEADFELFNAAADRREQVMSGAFRRIYPRSMDNADAGDQLFRELISFSQPAFLSGLAWLTFRFITPDEDVLWLHSPAIGKTRELTGANRADPMARSAFSPDDLLVWSGKPSLVQARLDRILTALVPFSRPDMAQLSAQDRECEKLSAADINRGLKWNFDSLRFVDGSPWLPVGPLFIPRRLYRVELVSRDPFSLYGRQMLYVDASMMLPVYKVVFDRAGRLWKIVMAAPGLAASQDRTRRMPYYAWIVAVDFLKNQSSIVQFSSAAYCRRFGSHIKLSDFDPRRLDPEGGESGEPAASPAATAAPDDSDAETDD